MQRRQALVTAVPCIQGGAVFGTSRLSFKVPNQFLGISWGCAGPFLIQSLSWLFQGSVPYAIHSFSQIFSSQTLPLYGPPIWLLLCMTQSSALSSGFAHVLSRRTSLCISWPLWDMRPAKEFCSYLLHLPPVILVNWCFFPQFTKGRSESRSFWPAQRLVFLWQRMQLSPGVSVQLQLPDFIRLSQFSFLLIA